MDVRKAMRDKLIRAMTDAVSTLLAREGEQTRAQLGALTDEVATLRRELDALSERLDGFENRTRRDLFLAGDVAAVTSSSAFVTEYLPTALAFGHPHDTLRHALSLVDGPGLACEFGVATGTTLRIVTGVLPDRHVAGFDTFTGLPETWRTNFFAGEFAQDDLPEVPGAELVAGLFADTLPGWLAEHEGPLAFLHLDADLYSATATVLDLVADRLRPGTVVVFDEYFNYPGWQVHEHRAWTEFVARTGWSFRYEAYTADHEQLVLVLTS